MKLNSAFRKFILLAPAGVSIPESLKRNRVSRDARRYEDYLYELQTLRGGIYIEDGAIESSELVEGRHVAESDFTSWHLLILDRAGRTCGCVRYREYPSRVKFSDLMAAKSSLASCSKWGSKMRAAVEDELLLSDAMELPFVEIGGWALDADIRGTAEALRMVLGAYALAREFGGAVGLATATVRHSSASILRRVGGQRLEHRGEQVPLYTDHHYKCDMELLRFYSWALNPRFDAWTHEMGREIRNVAVVSADEASTRTKGPVCAAARIEKRAPGSMGRVRGATRLKGRFGYPFSAIAPAGVE